MSAPAFAGDKGKTPGGCSNPYTPVTYDGNGQITGDADLSARNQQLLDSGVLTPAQVAAIYTSLDHNGDNVLCAKLPDGWNSGNTDNRTGFLNFVDNKS